MNEITEMLLLRMRGNLLLDINNNNLTADGKGLACAEIQEELDKLNPLMEGHCESPIDAIDIYGAAMRKLFHVDDSIKFYRRIG